MRRPAGGGAALGISLPALVLVAGCARGISYYPAVDMGEFPARPAPEGEVGEVKDVPVFMAPRETGRVYYVIGVAEVPGLRIPPGRGSRQELGELARAHNADGLILFDSYDEMLRIYRGAVIATPYGWVKGSDMPAGHWPERGAALVRFRDLDDAEGMFTPTELLLRLGFGIDEVPAGRLFEGDMRWERIESGVTDVRFTYRTDQDVGLETCRFAGLYAVASVLIRHQREQGRTPDSARVTYGCGAYDGTADFTGGRIELVLRERDSGVVVWQEGQNVGHRP